MFHIIKLLILQNNIIGSVIFTEGVLGMIVTTCVSLSSILHKTVEARSAVSLHIASFNLFFFHLQVAVQRDQDKAGHIILASTHI